MGNFEYSVRSKPNPNSGPPPQLNPPPSTIKSRPQTTNHHQKPMIPLRTNHCTVMLPCIAAAVFVVGAICAPLILIASLIPALVLSVASLFIPVTLIVAKITLIGVKVTFAGLEVANLLARIFRIWIEVDEDHPQEAALVVAEEEPLQTE